MSDQMYQVGRATIADVPELCRIWRDLGLPVDELEKRFSEFQVARDGAGNLVGAIGIAVSGLDGLLHSEAIVDPIRTDIIRDELWSRVRTLAANRGLARIWTLETAPFWQRVGFSKANIDQLKKLPEIFGKPEFNWFRIQLRDEDAIPKSIEAEFALFVQQQRAETERLIHQARFLKLIATVLAVIILIFVIFAAIHVIQYKPSFSPR